MNMFTVQLTAGNPGEDFQSIEDFEPLIKYIFSYNNLPLQRLNTVRLAQMRF